MRIGIKGYQSLTSAIVDINPGEIAVLRGPNNSGKSAFLRGIGAFITNNPTQEDYINVDVGSTRVLIKDDKLYEWNRTETKVKYLVDGKEEVKLNRASIAEVIPEAGFLYVRADAEKFLPQICEEGNVWFPYNYPASVAFKIFSKFMAPPKISVLIKDLRDNIKKDKDSLLSARGRIDAYETEFSKLSEDMEGQPSLSEVDALLKRVSKWIEGKQKYDTCKSKYGFSITRQRHCKGIVNGYEVRKDGFKEIQEKMVEYQKLRKESSNLGDSLIRFTELVRDKEVLSKRILDLSGFIEKNKSRVNKIGETRELVKKLVSCRNRATSVKERISSFENVINENIKKKEKYKVCPLCERPFEECQDHMKM